MQFWMMMGVCKCHDNQFWSRAFVESIVTDAISIDFNHAGSNRLSIMTLACATIQGSALSLS